jgi:hypothetical protein
VGHGAWQIAVAGEEQEEKEKKDASADLTKLEAPIIAVEYRERDYEDCPARIRGTTELRRIWTTTDKFPHLVGGSITAHWLPDHPTHDGS